MFCHMFLLNGLLDRCIYKVPFFWFSAPKKAQKGHFLKLEIVQGQAQAYGWEGVI